MVLDANAANRLAQTGSQQSTSVSKQASQDAKTDQLLDDSQSVFSALAETDNGAGVTKSEVKKFFQKAGQKGIGLNQKHQQDIQEQLSDFSKLFDAGEQAEDAVMLQSSGVATEDAPESRQAKKSAKNAAERQAGRFARQLTGQQTSLTKEYAAIYAKYLSGTGQGSDGQIDDLETLLRKEGFSNRDVHDLQKSIKKVIRAQLKEQARDIMLEQQLSTGDMWAAAKGKHAVGALTSYLFKKEKLGGPDMGQADGFEGILREATVDSMLEVKGFIQDLYINVAMEKQIRGQGVAKENVQQIFTLANRVGFNLQENFKFLDQLRENLGLDDVKLPEEDREVDLTDDQSDDGNSGKHKRQQTPEQELESKVPKVVIEAVNALRNALVADMLKPGFKTKWDVYWQQKESLKAIADHGFPAESLLENIKQDALESVKLHYYQQLKDLALQRSSILQVKSATYQQCIDAIAD
jgi:hypothetical protein